MGHFEVPVERKGSDGTGYGVADRPNVIWLITDQHRHHAQGFAGDPNLHTPNLDNLAHMGLTCERGAVSGYALCCPYRGSLLTSRWPHECIPVHEAPLPDGMPTVATAFNAAGYHTAWYGKWHVDGAKEREGRAGFWIVPPERRGDFQEWVGYDNNNSQWDTWVHGGEGESAFLERLDGWETDVLTDRFIAYIERQSAGAKPFFAALSVQPPHGPCQCPAEFRRLRPDEVVLRPNVPPGSEAERAAREATPGYYGMIENWDMNVGRIVAALHRLGLYEKTHIMIFADHGDMLGSHGHFGKVVPYEESIRVPFIFAGCPQYGRLKGGRTSAFLNHVDIAPTSLGLAGVPPPDWMCGTDWSHVRTGKAATGPLPDSAYIQAIEPREQSPAYRAIVTADNWKYAATEQGPWLMFNLNDDPYEMANLAHRPRHRQQQDRMHARLLQWIADTGDSF
jgi:arylsulfatase A-like enzyme